MILEESVDKAAIQLALTCLHLLCRLAGAVQLASENYLSHRLITYLSRRIHFTRRIQFCILIFNLSLISYHFSISSWSHSTPHIIPEMLVEFSLRNRCTLSALFTEKSDNLGVSIGKVVLMIHNAVIFEMNSFKHRRMNGTIDTLRRIQRSHHTDSIFNPIVE